MRLDPGNTELMSYGFCFLAAASDVGTTGGCIRYVIVSMRDDGGGSIAARWARGDAARGAASLSDKVSMATSSTLKDDRLLRAELTSLPDLSICIALDTP